MVEHGISHLGYPNTSSNTLLVHLQQLKPRSADASHRNRQRQSSSKGNPFGSAIPREEILEKRGIDVKTVDSKFERKAALPKYTAAQDAQLEQVRSDLEKISATLREANEMELPEEEFRLKEDEKRKELNSLMEQFAAAKFESQPEAPESRHYSISSGYRHSDKHRSSHKARDNDGFSDKHQNRGRFNDQPEIDKMNPDFSSFSNNRRRGRAYEKPRSEK